MKKRSQHDIDGEEQVNSLYFLHYHFFHRVVTPAVKNVPGDKDSVRGEITMNDWGYPC